jgi:hypothetical protein
MSSGAVASTIVGNASNIELPNIENLTIEEAIFLLGPAHGYNVSQTGLVTFENGSSWQIVRCPNTRMTVMKKVI